MVLNLRHQLISLQVVESQSKTVGLNVLLWEMIAMNGIWPMMVCHAQLTLVTVNLIVLLLMIRSMRKCHAATGLHQPWSLQEVPVQMKLKLP